MTDKAKIIRLIAKSVEQGKMSFNFRDLEEAGIFSESVNKFKSELMVWLNADITGADTEEQKKTYNWFV